MNRVRRFDRHRDKVKWSDYSAAGDYVDGVVECKHFRVAILQFLDSLKPGEVVGFENQNDYIFVYYRRNE